MRLPTLAAFSVLAGLVLAATAPAADVVLPQARNAYFSDEPIEIAVAGLDDGARAELELVPEGEGIAPVKIGLAGDGSTLCVRIPPESLAPGEYAIRLDGQPQREKLTVVRGVPQSRMLVSQTMRTDQLAAAGGNFAVSNAFTFGLLDRDGMPAEDVRRRSGGTDAQERLVAADVPSLIYMYWTGYVLHKPWGVNKSWAAEDMTENMRLMSFHVAQQLRRYRRNLISVGTLDEPGLSWGKTTGGGMATGFPNWDEQTWYEARGWKYTQNPASRSDEDWLRYTAIRNAILAEQNRQARQDLQSVCPEVVFSTDLYAPGAFMDGTDPWNQRVNQFPSTHVFMDWGMGKLGVIGGLYLEKAHDPEAKIAHAMNGQLFGKRVPQPGMRYAYHLMLNGMLAAGLKSNWWLNHGGMSPEDLLAVNEPAARIGPVLAEMAPSDHDTAVLWSFTEVSLRCKEITAKEAAKKTGEPIKLMVADLPENTAVDKGELAINAYSVGGNYRRQVLNVHAALNRAGYPAHILHERLLPQGVLRRYKTLVIVGQTHELPADVRKAIDDFAAAGGSLVVDRTSTVAFDGAIAVDAGPKDPGYQWNVLFTAKPDQFASPREASYFQTNLFMDSFARRAVPAMKAAMEKTGSRSVITTDCDFLGCERHTGGKGEVIMVLNGYEKLPDLPDTESYSIYNHAPYETTFTLDRVEPGHVVYAIEGLDWRHVSRVRNPTGPQTVRFEPGEMKLYLVAPQEPAGLGAIAGTEEGRMTIGAEPIGLGMPCPLEVSITGPGGQEVLHVWRATGADGRYTETFPLGQNAPPGKYAVSVTSPVAGLEATVEVLVLPGHAAAESIPGPVRVFDADAIAAFLRGKPPLTIAVATDEHRRAAERLARSLRSKGIPVKVAAEKDVWHKALYPRVWDPYVTVYHPADGPADLTERDIKRTGTIETTGYNHHVVRDESGAELADDWREEGTLLTVVGRGFVAEDRGKFLAAERGCKVYVGDRKKLEVVAGTPEEVQTTKEVRRRWSRPWHKLEHFVGAWHLVPELPEAYAVYDHLILLGDSTTGELVRALQASELLPQVADDQYPGPGKALVSFAWSPFALDKNVILVAATDHAGIDAGTDRLIRLAAADE